MGLCDFTELFFAEFTFYLNVSEKKIEKKCIKQGQHDTRVFLLQAPEATAMD